MRQITALFTLLFLITVPVLAQTPAVDVILTVSDGAGGSQQLRFGLDPLATDGIDAALGELELPPMPPTGVFDARFIGGDIGLSFGQGLAKDYRQGSASTSAVRIHELQYQVGSGTSITISWTFPAGVTAKLQDIITGSLIDQTMSGNGSYIVANPGAFSKLKMTVTYALSVNPPTVTTVSASNVTSSGAQLNGTLNPNGASTTYYFEYGTATSYGSQTTTSDGGSGSTAGNVSAPLTGLTSSMTYHYRLVATNSGGTNRGSDMTFTTAAVVLPPTVTTGSAGGITATGAQLSGTVNPNGASTTYFFEYGTTASYGFQTSSASAGSASVAGNVSATLTNLISSMAYHYRLIATNSAGTSRGSDLTFTTAQPPSQPAAVDISMTVADGAGGIAQLKFGVDPAATDGVDAAFGELELPPTPPTGVFDARFVGDDIGISLGQGMAKDYRQGAATLTGTRTHELRYQVGSGSSITITWNLPTGVTGRLQDVITGALIDQQMNGSGSYTVTNPGGFSKLKMTVTYALTPVTRPVVTTMAATSIATNGATLNGTVLSSGANFSWYFEYGGTTAYGSQTTTTNLLASPTPVNVTSFLTGLTPNALYHFRLVATNSAGTTPGSDLTFTTAGAPPRVTLLSPSNGTMNLQPNPVLTWNPSTGATGYRVEVSTSPDFSTIVFSRVGTTTSQQTSGLEVYATYYWRVTASNAAGASAPSEFWLFTTTGPINVVPSRVWTTQSSGTTQNLYCVSAVSELVAWACGYNGTIVRTTDGGARWNTVQAPSSSSAYYAMSAIDENTLLISGLPIGGTSSSTSIYRTTNAGTSWSKVFDQPGGWISAIDMFDSQNGFAVGDPVGGIWTMLRSSDGGQSWQPIANPPAALAGEVGVNMGNTFWIGNQLGWLGTSKNRILKTSDGGATWGSIAVPQLAEIWTVSYVPSGALMACGSNTLLRSTNQGQTWETLTLPAAPSQFQVTRVCGGVLWLSVGTSLFSSTNAGTSWQAGTTLSGNIRNFTFKVQGSKEYGWVVGQGGAIKKYQVVYTGISDPKDEQIPAGFVLEQNYPNPFNPSTAISYQLSAVSFVNLKIVDLLGQEVSTLVNGMQSAGKHSVQWDASGMPSGVYLYKLTAGDASTASARSFVAVKRMVLLR